MIEAANSVLSNASVSLNAAERQSTARSLSANPDKVQEVARTPFVSPAISIDRQSNRAIIQIRDSDTGDVVRQFPTEGQLKAYRQAQEFSERQKSQAESQVREATGASSSAVSSELSAPASDLSAVSAPAPTPTSVETQA